MSFLFKSLSGLETVSASTIANGHRITVISGDDMYNVAWGDMHSYFNADLEARVEALEQGGGGGGGGPSIWPAARNFTLTGLVNGSGSGDGSTDIAITTTIADESIPVIKVVGLTGRLGALETSIGNKWGTGYTNGSQPTTFGGDLNSISGAVFLQTQAGTTNSPGGNTDPANWTILSNGPINFAQQLGMKDGALKLRSQSNGTFGQWNEVYHKGNLDADALLLKTDVATAALKLANGRSFKLLGTVTSDAVNFDGTGNVSLTTSIGPNALQTYMVAGLDSSLQWRPSIQASNLVANDHTSPGHYHFPSAEVSTATGFPVSSQSGTLTVIAQSYDDILTQLFTADSGRMYSRARIYNGTGSYTWTPWREPLYKDLFDPNTKFDKTGGTITGDVLINGNLSGRGITGNAVTVDQAMPTSAGKWAFLVKDSSGSTGQNDSFGLWQDSSDISLVNTRNGNWYSLSISDTGVLKFRNKTVWDEGNFNPEVPVPSSGVLYIGNAAGTHLRFRSDGKYSIDSGNNWRSFNEVQPFNPTPQFETVTIGAEKNIYLYTDAGDGNTLQVRTGSAAIGWKYFQFKDNGNFQVPNGRVLIGGYEAWHAGNFNPATKLGVDANAVSASKLATVRTINGVAFDGTASITIPNSPLVSSLSDVTVRVPSGQYQMSPEDSTVAHGLPDAVKNAWNFVESITHTNTSNYFATQRLTSFNDIAHSYIRAVGDNPTSPWYRDWNEANLPNPLSRNGGDMIGSLMSYIHGYFTPAWDAPLITKSFDPFTSGKWNGIGRWGVFMESGRIGFGIPEGAISPKVFEYGADSSIVREHSIYTTGNLTPLDRNVGGNVLNPINIYTSAVGTQTRVMNFGWNNAAVRWAQVLEADASYAIYSYDTSGNGPTQQLSLRNYNSASNLDKERALEVFGGIRVRGGYAGFTVGDRNSNYSDWTTYAANGQYNIYNWTAATNLLSMDQSGNASVAGALWANRIFSGWDAGTGGSISCSNWFRTTGNTGIYFSDYGGGLYMIDSTYVRTYNGKGFVANNIVLEGSADQFIQLNPTGGRSVRFASTVSSDRSGFWDQTAGHWLLMFQAGAACTFVNTVTATDFILSSDRKLKQDIKPLTFDLPLRPVRYVMKSSQKQEIGFIAQDVEKLLPEAVSRNDDGFLGIAYPRLTAYLAAQNNHQQKLIDKQQKTIQAQERFLKSLKCQVAKQQTQINKILKMLKAA